MNEDLRAACAAWLCAQPAIVAAFGEDLSTNPPTIKFWSGYSAFPAVPYLVFSIATEDEGFETKDADSRISTLVQGTITCQVFAESEADAYTLLDQVSASETAGGLTDAPLTFSVGNLIYFRRTGGNYPAIPQVGPDGIVAAFSRACAFKFMYETSPVPL